MNDEKRIAALTEAVDQSDKARAEATALLSAVIRKFGGTIYLTKPELDAVHPTDAVVKNVDASGSILLQVGYCEHEHYTKHLVRKIKGKA
jgi:hypothetical protein